MALFARSRKAGETISLADLRGKRSAIIWFSRGYACPFCRQLSQPGETNACPDCGLGLKDLAKLPPSYDAQIEYPEEPTPPHMETLPWTYAARNRALLTVGTTATLTIALTLMVGASPGLRRPVEKRIACDHFRYGETRAHRPAELPERTIGDAGHRGQDHIIC